MKIYLFYPETGVYLGEDFAEESLIREGEVLVGRDATTLAPPAVEPGGVPVFSITERCWRVRPLSELRSRQTGSSG